VTALTEPTGTPGLVFWMLCVLDGEATTTQIRGALDAEGDYVAHASAVSALHRLATRNLIAEAEHGMEGRASLWRLTALGKIIAKDGEPCGLGWPS
jgi:hypothetical protein